MTENCDLKSLKEKFCKCLKLTIEKEAYLIEKDVSERAIAHKLAEYLQKEFQDYNVDCEYNRKYDEVKLRSDRERGFVPDIIVHKRGTDENLMIVELKKTGRRKNEEKERLKEAINDPLKYCLGVYVELRMRQSSNKVNEVCYFSRDGLIEDCFESCSNGQAWRDRCMSGS